MVSGAGDPATKGKPGIEEADPGEPGLPQQCLVLLRRKDGQAFSDPDPGTLGLRAFDARIRSPSAGRPPSAWHWVRREGCRISMQAERFDQLAAAGFRRPLMLTQVILSFIVFAYDGNVAVITPGIPRL